MFLLGCGDVDNTSLVVAESHVVRDGQTGDVAVAWGKLSGIAAWAALDKHRVELVRVRDDGAPLATFEDFPVGASSTTMVRAAPTRTGFALVTGQPEAFGLVAALSTDVVLAGTSALPKAKAIALAPPIVAIVEPMFGGLMLGDVGNDSPREVTAVRDAPTNLLGVGAAFATRHGIVVMVGAHGCVSALSVTDFAKPTGHVSETRCLDGDWDKASVVAWSTAAGSDPESFAVAVGLTGVVDDVPNTTKGFALDLRVGSRGHVTVVRAAAAPLQPSANAFVGQGDTLVWDASEAGGDRAVTATSATTWIGMTAANEGASSRVLARAISLQ